MSLTSLFNQIILKRTFATTSDYKAPLPEDQLRVPSARDPPVGGRNREPLTESLGSQEENGQRREETLNPPDAPSRVTANGQLTGGGSWHHDRRPARDEPVCSPFLQNRYQVPEWATRPPKCRRRVVTSSVRL